MDREEAAFQRLHPQLEKTLKGMYVAIYEGQLVDHDADQVALYLRIRAKYGQAFVWIAPVLAEAEYDPYAVGRLEKGMLDADVAIRQDGGGIGVGWVAFDNQNLCLGDRL